MDKQEEIAKVLNLSICISAQDGILSKIEEDKVFDLINQKIKKVSKSKFSNLVDAFFESDDTLEYYLESFEDPKMLKLALDIAKEAASADGLDIKENIAYQKRRYFLSRSHARVYRNSPDPSNEIQMLSKIGYTLETALSDIIDNSISAGAKNIEILSLPKEEIFWSVIDDGIGMDSSELIENMRIGCKDPTKEREQMDLGRFGAGMKTASISQAKEVTVFSKTKTSKLSAAKWDVEKICEAKKWNLQLLSQKEYPSFDYLKLENNRSGTQVCWENLSRYSEQDHLIAERLHAEDIVRVKKHLSIHFHKFMSEKNKIKFTVNGDLLKPTDPFMSNLNGYDEGPSSEFRIKNNERIYIKVHNIPHWSKLSKENLDFYGGQSEITKKQGLYIYRANRLIIEGGWMGLTGNSQLGDLARVEINIPVSLDEEWKTDVKKSSLQLPPKIKTMLREMIRTPINKSKRTYKYRGSKEESNPYWIKRK